MAQDINLRRLVIKSFHIDTVEWGDHNDVTADGRMTVSRELLDELMEENKDIIEKIDIQIIKPGDHDRWTNTIMDIIPVSTKVLGILGEGITHTLTGVYFMMTGVDVDGVSQATKTSKGIVNAVNQAIAYFDQVTAVQKDDTAWQTKGESGT